MAPPIYLRGASGIWTLDGKTFSPTPISEIDTSNSCRCMVFSEDGSVFAWCNATSTYIMDTKTNAILHDLKLAKVVDMKFSPLANILVTWSTYTVNKETKAGTPNMNVIDVKTGAILKTLIQKKAQHWTPSWSCDEELCMRVVNNELHFYEKNNFNTVVTRLHVQKVGSFSLSQCVAPYTFAANFPGNKGQPSFVRIYNYPMEGVIASKSFFKGDRVDFYWNKKGNSVVILTSTESSDSSYYGEQGLHFLDNRGESCFVPMQKEGPIYHVEWSPGDKEFVVMHGYMPCKATIYNLKCEPTFDFGTGPWSSCSFNPQGNILLLAGFGNLPGNLEFWDYNKKQLISKTQAPDSTHFAWCPDGQHLMTSTTAPRLRVGNGYRVWHYSGTLMVQHAIPNHAELWQATFQPLPDDKMPVFSISKKTVTSVAEQPKPKTEAYRPPQARGVGASFKPKPIQEFEAPSNVRKAAGADAGGQGGKVKDGVYKQGRLPPGMSAAAAAAATAPKPGADALKRIKLLKKKVKDIEKMKQSLASGATLNPDQEVKMKQLDSITEELKALQLQASR